MTRRYLGPGLGCSEALHVPKNNYTLGAALPQAPSSELCKLNCKFIPNSGILNLLNTVLKVFISKSVIHAHSILLDLQRGPLRTPYIIPSLHVLKPAVSINTAHCIHSAGTTSQQGLHPSLNHSCQAEPRALCPSCLHTGFGVAEPPSPPHEQGRTCPPLAPRAQVPLQSILHRAVHSGARHISTALITPD